MGRPRTPQRPPSRGLLTPKQQALISCLQAAPKRFLSEEDAARAMFGDLPLRLSLPRLMSVVMSIQRRRPGLIDKAPGTGLLYRGAR